HVPPAARPAPAGELAAEAVRLPAHRGADRQLDGRDDLRLRPRVWPERLPFIRWRWDPAPRRTFGPFVSFCRRGAGWGLAARRGTSRQDTARRGKTRQDPAASAEFGRKRPNWQVRSVIWFVPERAHPNPRTIADSRNQPGA